MSLILDARWDGHYGIGRVGREIRSRLTSPGARPFNSKFDPLSASGVAHLWTQLGRRGNVFYSPGFTGTFPNRSKQVLTVWDLAHLEKSHSSPTKVAYYNSVIRPTIWQARSMMTGSPATIPELRRWLGPRGDHVTISPIGCGISEDFTGAGRSPDPRHVLMVSNTQPHKNVETALRALACTDREILMRWVTTDRARANVLLDQFDLGHRVAVYVNLSDTELAHIYRTSAALVFPSVSEGFGLPPIEAMACGTPVIFADTCKQVSLSCSGEPANQAIYDPHDPSEWASAITAAVREPKVASHFDASNYTWTSVAARVAASLRLAGCEVTADERA